MNNRISITDYNADWAFKENFQHPRTKPGYLTPEEIVAFYGTLGVGGVEYTHAYWGDCPVPRARQIAADAGLPIICYVFPADLVHPPSAHPAAIDEAKSLLDRTAALGAKLAMILPAFIKEGIPLQEQRKWLVEGLRPCAEHARSVGVTMCIENLDYPPGRPFHLRGSQCRDLCAEIDHPGFRLIYDCGATLFADEDFLATLRDMAPYIAHVHVKNSRRVSSSEQPERYLDSKAGGVRYTGTVLDAGAVPIEAVVKELKQRGYKGYFLIEYQGEDDPRPTAAHNVEYLRRLLSNS